MSIEIIAATAILARYAVANRFETLPASVVHEAQRALLNWTGCAIGASAHSTVENAWTAMRPCAGAAQATLLGRRERTDILNAALVNGIASHVLDFDDTHPDMLVHPSGPVASAVLALAEQRRTSGRNLINAFVVGVEVECRIARAVLPAHYDVGWHITGTAGVFGAAAASARLLGLDEERTTWALGLAATQAAGLREMFASMAKSFHPGRAAQNGPASALFAQAGFTASATAIEGKRGFARVLSTTVSATASTNPAGKTAMQNSISRCSDPMLLAAVKIRRNLATKNAALHGCKRETAALSAMRHCICPVAASRVRFARLHKAAASP